MGEVYRATDPRLGRDVAVKVVRSTGAPDPGRLERFEREARAVAALSHPNVLTVHDVGHDSGHPYVVFELLEGETLRERLERGPLPMRRAIEVAADACRGLEAAHARSLVHRDLKPENVFLTSDGRVKILDFGLAKLRRGEGIGELRGDAPVAGGPPAADGPGDPGDPDTQTADGVILGTLGYLSPEQARGLTADARSDLFALGAVLYEMLSGRRAFKGKTPADTLSAILQKDPPALGSGSGPLPPATEQIVRRCLAKEPDERFHSAHDLALALEALLERSSPSPASADTAETPPPYPGLSSFDERDAPRFFGRDADVETLWRRLKAHALLAVIGPSGAGKTSFVRAGVVAHRPPGWVAVVTTPGTSPLQMLGQAMVPALQSDVDALRYLVRFEDPDVAADVLGRWARAHEGALLVVDQFEELFTLNPPEVQERFAALLGRLAEEGAVHVLLSMRDDFLMRCQSHEALAPIFTELTPLGPLSGRALRQALEEPAKAEGFRFEAGLVDTMLEAVEGERGALPLLAFAVSRLWDHRDRERHLLTHEAYGEIGGVAGALARHAESTLERIGPDRRPVVRELFRNLVTSQETRAVVEREELLSVFPDRAVAAEVLDELIRSRLLTSYESGEALPRGASPAQSSRGAAPRPAPQSSRGAPSLPGDEGSTIPTPAHRIEIVHESLLTSWLRLVRWQAQDAAGALLRDQLKQAARLWDDRGRPEDLLWTGASYLEFRAWRARYPGGLSSLEDEFSEAMTELANRRRRRRRVAVTAALLISLLGAAGALTLWARAERARQHAAEQTLRQEAAQLLSLGRLRLAERRAEALAFAIASLERADSAAGRRFALEVLWDGPPEWEFGAEEYGNLVTFSPDGRWAASGGMRGAWLWSRDGGPPRRLGVPSGNAPPWIGFTGDSLRVAVCDWAEGVVRAFSVDDARDLGVITATPSGEIFLRDDRLITWAQPDAREGSASEVVELEAWPLDGGGPQPLGSWDLSGLDRWGLGGTWATFDREGQHLVEARDGVVAIRRLEALDRAPQVLGRHEGAITASFDPTGRTVLSISPEEIRLWARDVRNATPVRVLRPPGVETTWGPPEPSLDPSGRWVAAMIRSAVQKGDAWCMGCRWSLYDLMGPPHQAPRPIRDDFVQSFSFDSTGNWLLSAHNRYMSLRFLGGARFQDIPFPGLSGGPVFSPDGRSVAAQGHHEIRLFPLAAEAEGDAGLVHREPDLVMQEGLVFDPEGRFVVASAPFAGRLVVAPLSGQPVRHLQAPGPWLLALSVSPDGRLVATSHMDPSASGSTRLGVWDLETGERRDLDARKAGDDCGPSGPHRGSVWSTVFLPDGTLISAGMTGLRQWDLVAGTSEKLRDCLEPYNLGFAPLRLDATPNGHQIVTLAMEPGEVSGRHPSRLTVFDLESRTTREITTHGTEVRALALDPTGRILVTDGYDGVLRVGPLTGEEPHLLVGRPHVPSGVAVSPDGRWIASGAHREGVIRLWPMPDLTRPPFHTLPHEEVLRRLRTNTNLRVVPDPDAEGGYRIEPGPFPGWAKPPEW